MNKALLEQISAAKDAGTRAMAKDFFAPTPGAGGDELADSAGAPIAEAEGAEMPVEGGGEEQLTPEQLEELLQLLQSQGGAAGGEG